MYLRKVFELLSIQWLRSSRVKLDMCCNYTHWEPQNINTVLNTFRLVFDGRSWTGPNWELLYTAVANYFMTKSSVTVNLQRIVHGRPLNYTPLKRSIYTYICTKMYDVIHCSLTLIDSPIFWFEMCSESTRWGGLVKLWARYLVRRRNHLERLSVLKSRLFVSNVVRWRARPTP